MPEPVAVRDLAALQLELTARWHAVPPSPLDATDVLARLVAENHRHNFLLWHEEDLARRDDLGPERVRQAKRSIDRHNQARNDAMESLDRELATRLHPRAPGPGCPAHSETPGMMLDRLSILALKAYHMAEQANRTDAPSDHRERCAEKLARIQRQRADLLDCLASLADEIAAGTRTFRLYGQFKMYNDPALNPELYRQAKCTAAASTCPASS
jgi:hypothetical protein